MPIYVYSDEETRYYPYPPFAREMRFGDRIELPEDQVPRDGRFVPAPDEPTQQPPPAPAEPAGAQTATSTPVKSKEA